VSHLDWIVSLLQEAGRAFTVSYNEPPHNRHVLALIRDPKGDVFAYFDKNGNLKPREN
jgi:pyruvate-formate lyase-activating enzyme